MTVLTGEAITLFRWAAMRGAVRLENLGIRVRPGPKVLPQAKKELGLKRNASVDEVLTALDKKIEESRAKLGPEDIT